MSAATAKYEKVFPDRFLKYKFREAPVVIFGILEELDHFPQQMKKVVDGMKFSEEAHNCTARHAIISYTDIIDLTKGKEIETSLDIVVAPMDISILENVKGFVACGFFDATETIILSAAPKLNLSTSLSFLSMDFMSAVGICLFAVVVSLLLTRKLWHAIVTKPRGKLSEVMTPYLRVLWDVFSVFFFEPYPSQLEGICERLAYAFWVIGVTFIGFLMSCFLKSEFFNEKYFFIETFEDLQYAQRQANVQPLMLKDAMVHNYLTNRAKQDEELNNWMKNNLNEENFCEPFDMASTYIYEEILGGHKALIINEQILSFLFGFVLSDNMDVMREWKTKFDGFYFSKGLKSDYVVFPANSSFFSNPLFRENYQKGVLIYFETKALSFYDFPSKYAMDFVRWERPMKTVSDLSIFAVASVFYIALWALTICVATLFVELIVGWKKRERKLRRRYIALCGCSHPYQSVLRLVYRAIFLYRARFAK